MGRHTAAGRAPLRHQIPPTRAARHKGVKTARYDAYVAMVLTYRQISIDAAQPVLADGRFRATFYDAARYIGGCSKVTEIPEKALIRWLLLLQPARELWFGELGFPSWAFYKPEVVEPFYSRGEGDLDLILCNRHAPHEAAVLECKRVKIVVEDAEHHALNRLADTREGVGQANRVHSWFGFSQTYLTVITSVEASAQEDTNIPCRGIDAAATPDFGQTKTFRRIVEFPGRDDLNPEIGIVFVEVVQPSGLSIDQRVTLRVCVHQAAQPRTQSSAATNQIELVLRERNAA